MKRILTLVFIFISSLLFVSCTTGHTVENFEVLELDLETIEYVDYPATPNYGMRYLIHDRNDLSEIHQYKPDIMKYFEKYDIDFFRKSTLIVIGINDHNNYEYTKVSLHNGNLTVAALEVKPQDDNEQRKVVLLIEANGKVGEQYTLHISRDAGERFQYKISEFSDQLVDYTLDAWYYSGEGEDIQPNIEQDLVDMLQPENYDKLSIIELIRESYYYTCAYLNKDVIELLDQHQGLGELTFSQSYSDKWWVAYSGKDFYYQKFWYQYKIQESEDYEGQKITKEDLIFYDIPKSKPILEEMNNYVLISVMEQVAVRIKDINEFKVKEKIIFIENKSYYESNIDIYAEWLNSYDLMRNTEKALILEGDNNLSISTMGYPMIGYYYLQLIKASYSFENIEEEEYLNIGNSNTVVNGQDLKEVIEYKEKELEDGKIEILFKWSEVIKYLKNINE